MKIIANKFVDVFYLACSYEEKTFRGSQFFVCAYNSAIYDGWGASEKKSDISNLFPRFAYLQRVKWYRKHEKWETILSLIFTKLKID